MGNGFIYGHCRPWRAKISTDFCQRYKDSGKDKCQTCPGLEMDMPEKEKPLPVILDDGSKSPSISFGDQLKAMMVEKKMTQRGLARNLGVCASTVNRWIKNTTSPNGDQKAILDRVLSIDMAATDGALESATSQEHAGSTEPLTSVDDQLPLIIMMKILSCLEIILSRQGKTG